MGVVLIMLVLVFVIARLNDAQIHFNFTENHAKSGKQFYQTADWLAKLPHFILRIRQKNGF